MKTRAAVAFEAGKPLQIVELDLEGPKKGEVLVRITHTALCRTDAFALSGEDPEGEFPAVLGHEGAGFVVYSIGPDLKDDGGKSQYDEQGKYHEEGDIVWRCGR